MPSLFTDNTNHWHKRAEEMRTLADGVGDAETKEAMLRLANDYERLAQKAATRVSATPRSQ